MSDRDNITLPRKVLQYALQFVTNSRWGTWPYMEGQVYADAHDLAKALRTALDAEQPKPSEDIKALRRDAERYRWMKQEVKRIPPSWGLIGWDAAIDAAMEKKT